MTSKITMALAMTGLVSALTMGVGAGSADAATPSRAVSAEKAFSVQQVKTSKMKAAQLRQQQMMRKSAMKQTGGLKLPMALPVELPTEIGGCKLSMKSWQSTLNKMLKEEC